MAAHSVVNVYLDNLTVNLAAFPSVHAECKLVPRLLQEMFNFHVHSIGVPLLIVGEVLDKPVFVSGSMRRIGSEERKW